MNVVQAHNSANALEVGEAMKQHAEMGSEGQRQQEQLEVQQQQQKQESSSSNVGGTAYVAKGSGQASNGLRVSMEAGAAQEKVRPRLVYAGAAVYCATGLRCVAQVRKQCSAHANFTPCLRGMYIL